ncbi:hypothetical protein ACM25N_01455 [Roseovarius sp. C7]|uniref:hypothetical protein n=1 Tax=Roseovarius sp. C7 TaxID=3398643 RepID=UPI0039F4E694
MTDYLTPEIRAGLDRARKLAECKSSRLRLHSGDEIYRVLRAWDGGFALALETTPRLRGLVDLYDGSRHLSHCLIVASSEEGGELHVEYKRMTDAQATPPVDFERAQDAPAGYLPRF